jgi:hypothetical protein
MELNEPSGSELDLSHPASLAALHLRVATTLERSAELAEQHAERFSGEGQDQLARAELEQAERARAAARRSRDLAARPQPPERGQRPAGTPPARARAPDHL